MNVSVSPGNRIPPRTDSQGREQIPWWMLAACALVASAVVLGWAGLGDQDRLYREAGHQLHSPFPFRRWIQWLGLWALLSFVGPWLLRTRWRWTRGQKAAFAGWSMALLVGGQLTQSSNLDSKRRAYREGVARMLEQRVGPVEVRRRLEALSRTPDPQGLGFLWTNVFPEVPRGGPQTVLLSSAGGHPTATVSFRIPLGVLMLSADGPPVNPGRGLDHDFQWTHGIWISTHGD